MEVRSRHSIAAPYRRSSPLGRPLADTAKRSSSRTRSGSRALPRPQVLSASGYTRGPLAPKEEIVATSTATLTREQLEAIPTSYFKAVDAKDVDAILSHFADDATLTVETDHAVFTGAEEIRRMFTEFVENSVSIFHEIKNIVVDRLQRRSRPSRATSGSSSTAEERHAQLQLLRRRRRRPLQPRDHLRWPVRTRSSRPGVPLPWAAVRLPTWNGRSSVGFTILAVVCAPATRTAGVAALLSAAR